MLMGYVLTTVETGRNLSEISKRSSKNMIQDNTLIAIRGLLL